MAENRVYELIERYDRAKEHGDLRGLAEVGYVLAVLSRQAGQFENARQFAQECLAAAEQLPTATVDDVSGWSQSVAGVPIPDYFHDGVIRSRLADLLG